MSNREWRTVSQQKPCPACGKPDWCAWAPDAKTLRCMRGGDVPDGMRRASIDADGGTLYKPKSAPPSRRSRSRRPRMSNRSDTNVADTLDDALTFTGLGQVKVRHKHRLLSDNGPCYISGELSDYLQANGMAHTRGRPYHPQTQGKIERWHRSMKNQILLNNYYLPGELQEYLQRFISYYNHERYHESLNNLTPADVYYGRGQAILNHRETIKINTLAMRRKMHYDKRNNLNLMG